MPIYQLSISPKKISYCTKLQVTKRKSSLIIISKYNSTHDPAQNRKPHYPYCKISSKEYSSFYVQQYVIKSLLLCIHPHLEIFLRSLTLSNRIILSIHTLILFVFQYECCSGGRGLTTLINSGGRLEVLDRLPCMLLFMVNALALSSRWYPCPLVGPWVEP